MSMLPAWVVLLLALTASLWAWQLNMASEHRRLHHDFEMRADELQRRLTMRLDNYVQLLQSAAALFDASTYVSRDDWHNYVARIRLLDAYSGVRTLAFARQVSHQELDALVREVRASGVDDFAVRPPGQRDQYVVNVYAEPDSTSNRRHLGFDIWENPVRRAAMEAAMRSGEPAITSKLELLYIDAPDRAVPAFVMYMPVYVPSSRQVYGFVFSPFRMPALFDELRTAATAGVSLSIHDGSQATPDNVFGRDIWYDAAHAPRFVRQQVIELGGRQWTLVFSSTAGYEALEEMQDKSLRTLAAGILISLLLFALLRSMITTRQRALVIAAQMTRELRSNEERHTHIIHASMDGFLRVDGAGRLCECNEALCRMTGYSSEELLQRSIPDLEDNEDRDAATAHMARIRRDGRDRFESRWQRKDGSRFEVEVTATHLADSDEFCAFARDITLSKQHQRELDHIAHYDTLTSVPNRTLLSARMAQAVARTRRGKTLLAVCFLDLDDFKPINDRYGHEAGDQLLIGIANRLKSCLRSRDTVARMGGDEFVLLLMDLQSTEECEVALQRILVAVAQPMRVMDHEVAVTASLGVALFPRDNVDSDTLLRHADQSMYLAKQAGRNRYHIFDPERDRMARDRAERLTRIGTALQEHEFVLYYQPQVDMRSGRVRGVEALVRWQHPQHGLLPPADFLSVIEDSDHIIALGDWVITRALQQYCVWRDAGLDLRIGVNIAARHLLRADFVSRLQDQLAAHANVPPRVLELEVVETAALDDLEHVTQVIDACNTLGVSFALDDFGTGYSSLSYLKSLPAQLLKIDQSFVRDMLVDKDDCTIVEGVIGLARAFNRQVIAEGVETAAHGRKLLDMGCDLAQGYGIARPMPAEAVPDWVRNWRSDASWQADAATD